ncbi:MAG: hypothetical protein ACR2JR_16650 [Rubrobacteraceae bacterium]
MTSENPLAGEEQMEGQVEEETTGGGASIAIGFYIAGVVMIFGTILVLYGILGSPQNEKSLGININLWWGLITVAFWCVILGMSFASPHRRAARNGNGV